MFEVFIINKWKFGVVGEILWCERNSLDLLLWENNPLYNSELHWDASHQIPFDYFSITAQPIVCYSL